MARVPRINLRLYTGRDDLAYWVEELRRVHDYWSESIEHAEPLLNYSGN